MNIITALAISIGLLGGIATWVFLTLGTLQIWIAFLAWASFYHCGGGTAGFAKSLGSNIWGAIVGFVALLLIFKVNPGLPGVIWPSVVVGLTAFVLVMGARVKAFDAIPAAVYGYAAIAGYGLLSGADIGAMTLANPLICTVLSMVLGAVFGIVSEKLAGMLKGAD